MTDELEQIIMEAIDFCTHTRCKKCEYYGKDSAYDYKGKCRGRMMADHLRKNGVVVREKGEWDTVFYERNATISSFSHICPKCKYFYRDVRFKGHNFCPYCGADMTGGERNV